jgi:hypothetical protein
MSFGTLARIEFDPTPTVHLQTQPTISVDALDGPPLAVRDSEVVGRYAELMGRPVAKEQDSKGVVWPALSC